MNLKMSRLQLYFLKGALFFLTAFFVATPFVANAQAQASVITFDSNGGSGRMDMQICPTSPTKINKNTFSRNSYETFYGWAKTKGGPVVYQDEEILINHIGSMTLYAAWAHIHEPETIGGVDLPRMVFDKPIDNVTPMSTLTLDSGYYYLTSNLDTGNAINIVANNHVSICLNGYTINARFDVPSGTQTVLNLFDCNGSQSASGGKVTIPSDGLYNVTMTIGTDATVNIYGGTYDCEYKINRGYGAASGATIKNYSGNLNIYAGKFDNQIDYQDPDVTNVASTTLYNTNGNVNIHGGIFNNRSTGIWAGAYTLYNTCNGRQRNALLNIYQGEFNMNPLMDKTSYTARNNSECNIYGGIITNTSSRTGDAYTIYQDTKLAASAYPSILTVHGGSIKNQSQNGGKSSITVYNRSELRINDGLIENTSQNTGGSYGIYNYDGNVYMQSGKIHTSSATASSTFGVFHRINTFKMTDGEILNSVDGYGIYSVSTATAAAAVLIDSGLVEATQDGYAIYSADANPGVMKIHGGKVENQKGVAVYIGHKDDLTCVSSNPIISGTISLADSAVITLDSRLSGDSYVLFCRETPVVTPRVVVVPDQINVTDVTGYDSAFSSLNQYRPGYYYPVIPGSGHNAKNLVLDIDLHTVTFHSNGGNEVDSQLIPYGFSAVEPADPVRQDYTFLGWYLDNQTFANAWNFNDSMVVTDIDLFAKWARANRSAADIHLHEFPLFAFNPDENIILQTHTPSPNLPLVYTSSNPAVVEVVNSTHLIMHGAGSAVITVQSLETEDYLPGIDRQQIVIEKGIQKGVMVIDPRAKTARVDFLRETPDGVWSSNNPAVATVNGTFDHAVITETGAGTCTFTFEAFETPNYRGTKVAGIGYAVDAVLYPITVVNGSANVDSASAGTRVTLNAISPDTGKVFHRWVSQDVQVLDPFSEKSSFLMTGRPVTVTAEYLASGEFPTLGCFAIGDTIYLTTDSFGIADNQWPLSIRTRLDARYKRPFRELQTRRLGVKMTHKNEMTIRRRVLLLNQKNYQKHLKFGDFTRDILASDSAASAIQKNNAIVSLQCKQYSSMLHFHMGLPVILDSALTADSQYLVVQTIRGGSKTKAWFETKPAANRKVKKVLLKSMRDVKWKVIPEVRAIGDRMGGEIRVFKLSKKAKSLSGRLELVLDNRNGLTAAPIHE